MDEGGRRRKGQRRERSAERECGRRMVWSTKKVADEGQSERSPSSGEDRWRGMNDAGEVDKRIQMVGERPKEARGRKGRLKMLEQEGRLKG